MLNDSLVLCVGTAAYIVILVNAQFSDEASIRLPPKVIGGNLRVL